MRNKKIVTTFIGACVVMVILFFALLFIYDPLQIFHKSWREKEHIIPNMREQSLGIINYWEFDSIILGTSMLENTSSSEASEILGGRFVNLSMEGGNYLERSSVLSYALRRETGIKRVIFSLDHLGGVQRDRADFPLKSWIYLYDDNPINDFHIYFNDKYIKCLYRFSANQKCIGRVTDMDRPNAWYIHQVYAEKFGGVEKWFGANNSLEIDTVFESILKSIRRIENSEITHSTDISERVMRSKEYLDETILGLIKRYKSTEFILVLPPYSRVHYALLAQYDTASYQLYKESIRYLVTMSKQYPNLKIYGWEDHSFLDDLGNYKDLSHYHHRFNSWMLHAIAKKEGLLTPINIDSYLDTITDRALEYNLSILGDKIERYLQTKEKAN